MATIEGYLYYTQIKRPSTKFEPQWRVQLEVPKKTAQQFKKDYTGSKASVKEYTTEEFTEAFKVEPQASKEDEHYVISLRQHCYIKGDPVENPPRVFMKGDNGKLKDVTKKVEVGNGSKGLVQINPYFNRSANKTSAKLANVVIHDLVEYSGGGTSLDELGDIDEDSLEDNPVPAKGSSEGSNDDGVDDDVPFDVDDDDVAY